MWTWPYHPPHPSETENAQKQAAFYKHPANYNCTILYYFRLHHVRLHCTILTVHYTTLNYTDNTTPQPQLQLQLQLHYANYTTLQLHSTTLHYNYNYLCTTPHYIQQLWVRWPLPTIATTPKTQLQPPFGPSVNSLCHSWFATANLSYRFPIFKTSAAASCGTTGRVALSELCWFGMAWQNPESFSDSWLMDHVRKHSEIICKFGFHQSAYILTWPDEVEKRQTS